MIQVRSTTRSDYISIPQTDFVKAYDVKFWIIFLFGVWPNLRYEAQSSLFTSMHYSMIQVRSTTRLYCIINGKTLFSEETCDVWFDSMLPKLDNICGREPFTMIFISGENID